VKGIFNIEITNACNFRCAHCARPSMRRTVGYMPERVFRRCCELAGEFKMPRLILHNFGEPLLHPALPRYVRLARQFVPAVSLSTNGSLLSRALAAELADAGLTKLRWSAHRLELAPFVESAVEGLAFQFERKRGFWHDWGGRAAIKRAPKNRPRCVALARQWATVLWDGRVTRCCADVDGEGVFAHVFDADIVERELTRCHLCENCTAYEPV